MSNAITRRDIIEDEALKWGEEYSKMLQPALDKNKEFVDSIIALSEANKKLRASANDKEYILNLKQTNDLATQSTVVWKEQIQLENQLLSTKRKNELATEGTNKALIKEKALLAESNLEIKRQAIANGALESSYKKLAAQVAISGSKLKDIIATGRLASESLEQYNNRV